MGHILQTHILDNNKGGHDDLIFSITGLLDEQKFDSYYFSIAIEPSDAIQDIKNAVAKLFSYWLTETKKSNDGETIYLPIDFSDQYTGCLQVLSCGMDLQLRYGYSDFQGYNVNPLDPGDYSNSIIDFHDTENKSITVLKLDFLSSINEQIDRLQNGR